MANTPNLDLKKLEGDKKVLLFNHDTFYEDNFEKVDAFAGQVSAQLAETGQRIDNLVTTPVPTGEIIAEEIIDARDGEVSVGAKIRSVDVQLAQNAEQLINVKYPIGTGLKGAKGDGISDDTSAINTLVQYVKTNKLGGLWFPEGTYMIKATDDADVDGYSSLNGGIIIDSTMRLILHPNATLKAITNNKGGYAIVNIKNADNVYLQGGKILGDRYTHLGTAGESGFGIMIIASENIYIKDTYISDCWGDGICTIHRSPSPYKQCNNIHIDGVVSKNNRRQGMSIIDGRNIYISNSEFSGTNGTAPESGIDIEPDNGAAMVTDVFINNCIFDGNAGYGLLGGHGEGFERVSITNNIFKNNKLISINLVKTFDSVGKINKDAIITGNIVEQINNVGFAVAGATNVLFSDNNLIVKGAKLQTKGVYIDSDATDIVVSDNKITGYQYGVLFVDNTTPTNIKIKNNIFKDLEIGIYPNGNKNKCEIIGNDFDTISTLSSACIELGFTESEISGNTFTNLQGRGMFGAPVRCVISDNIFRSTGIANSALYESLYMSSNGSGCTVKNNVFLGSSLTAIKSDVASSTANIFIGNIATYNATPYNINVANRIVDNITSSTMTGTLNWTVGVLADGAGITSADILVTGAKYNDFVLVSSSNNLNGATITGYISGAGKVKFRIQNETGASIDLIYAIYKVKVISA